MWVVCVCSRHVHCKVHMMSGVCLSTRATLKHLQGSAGATPALSSVPGSTGSFGASSQRALVQAGGWGTAQSPSWCLSPQPWL